MSVINNTTILDEVSKTTIQLILKEPFYGHFFTGLIREVTESLPTMAVGATPNKMVKLYINPTFWTDVLTTPAYKYGVLKHEILHIVFKHITQSKNFSNKKIYNIAADIVVNQYIERSQLPEGAILIENFAELRLEPNKDVGYYYDKILRGWQNTCDSCNNGEPLEGFGKWLSDLMSQSSWQLDMHELWSKEFEKMTESERKIIDGLINTVLNNAVKRVGSKGIGSLPFGLKEYIDSLLLSLEPVVDWRRTLRLFAGSSMRSYLKNTIRRPSKRYGTTPGIKIKNRQKILVAVDTSGSINNHDLMEFFNELHHIWKQKAEICVVECDTEIHHTYMYKGHPPEAIHGRGGTDFNAPIQYANEKYLPDAIIYFTDGYANVPTIKSRKPILWLISSSGIDSEADIWEALPGRKVKMTSLNTQS
jgi:predicted metal-dependent peptidase